MTRRKKPEGTVRNHLVTVRLDDTEHSAVCDSAKEAGLSLSDYYRHQGVYGKVEIHNQIVADFPKLEKLTQEFSAIGNNLNQLTRYFHMGGVKSESMQEELRRCINEVMKMREELLAFGGEYRGYIKTSGK
jgi:hypothetical protein